MSDYFIGDWEGPHRGVKRAMVSLGPLSPKRYCTYACKFCYVDGDFQKYPPRTPEEVEVWLRQRREEFNIVYVSGDTDSFSPPRTVEGISLLKLIAKLDVDILFTTRYAFGEKDIDQLSAICDEQSHRGKLFVACSSVLSLKPLESEPRPVPSAQARLRSLGSLADIGATAVLALRPLLPDMQKSEIIDLLNYLPSSVRHVLSGWLYYAENRAQALNVTQSTSEKVGLYFDIAHNAANEYRNLELMEVLQAECDKRNLNSYIGSSAMIEHLRNQLNLTA